MKAILGAAWAVAVVIVLLISKFLDTMQRCLAWKNASNANTHLWKLSKDSVNEIP
jgi:hypothetical protein